VIKDSIVVEFRKTFSKELTEKGGYKLSDAAADGTLLLKPAIIELVINAPSKHTADRSNVLVQSAGRATLVLEIRDSVSGELLGKIIDKRKAHDYHRLVLASRSFNKFESRKMFRKWAWVLQDGLEGASH